MSRFVNDVFIPTMTTTTIRTSSPWADRTYVRRLHAGDDGILRDVIH